MCCVRRKLTTSTDTSILVSFFIADYKAREDRKHNANIVNKGGSQRRSFLRRGHSKGTSRPSVASSKYNNSRNPPSAALFRCVEIRILIADNYATGGRDQKGLIGDTLLWPGHNLIPNQKGKIRGGGEEVRVLLRPEENKIGVECNVCQTTKIKFLKARYKSVGVGVRSRKESSRSIKLKRKGTLGFGHEDKRAVRARAIRDEWSGESSRVAITEA